MMKMKIRVLNSNQEGPSSTVILLIAKFKVKQIYSYQRHLKYQIDSDIVWDVNSQFCRLISKVIKNNEQNSIN
jgi:hypothetical protein